jgi:hypothetical protein
MIRRQRWGIATALLAFSAAGVVAQTATAPAVEGKRKVQKAQAAAPGAAGQRVFVDPATGKITEPTPEQIQALEQAVAGMLSQSSEGLQVVELPDGTLTIDLEGRFQEVAIATVAPDGTVRTGCVNHPGQVKWVLKKKPAPAAPPLEVK